MQKSIKRGCACSCQCICNVDRLLNNICANAGTTTNYHHESRLLLPEGIQNKYPAVHVNSGKAISKALYSDVELAVQCRQSVESLANQINLWYNAR